MSRRSFLCEPEGAVTGIAATRRRIAIGLCSLAPVAFHAANAWGGGSTSARPWSEPFLFDVNGVVFQPESGNTKLGGDFTVGYNAGQWGVVGRADTGYRDLKSSQALSETGWFEGTLEGWYVGSDDDLRWEGRFVGGGSFMETDLTPLDGGDLAFKSEESSMGRGMLLGALRYEPSDEFAFGLWAGGGLQIERYDPLAVNRGTTDVGTETTTSFTAHARLRTQWSFLPELLAARLRIDAKHYKLTRKSITTTVSPGAVTQQESGTSKTLLDVSNRLFIDIEAASFVGFVPGLTGGFDYLRWSGSDEDTLTTLIPVFGAGIRREVF